MVKRKLIILISFLLSACVVAQPSSAYAYSCGGPIGQTPTSQEVISQYDSVFQGQVISIGRTVLFQVSATWKGMETSQIEISTGSGNGDCGYSFALGKNYMVYASKAEEGWLYTTRCGPTARVAGKDENPEDLSTNGKVVTSENIKALGQPNAPTKTVHLGGPSIAEALFLTADPTRCLIAAAISVVFGSATMALLAWRNTAT